jgi:NTP pyrophosphatase (non-canonical NTP hydrolase)
MNFKTYQAHAAVWINACLGPLSAADTTERNHRFLEEALELVQAKGCTAHEAHQLVDYVFNRPTGEPFQELGGVMVTLALLANAADLDMDVAAETELRRAWEIIDKIRAKAAAKPKFSALPQ